MHFYCWITLLTSAAIDRLVAGLVRKGHGVEPMSGDGVLTESEEDDIGCFLALEIRAISPAGRSCNEIIEVIYDDLTDVVAEREIKHFGFCLVAAEDSSVSNWSRGNVKASALPATPAVPPVVWERLGKPS